MKYLKPEMDIVEFDERILTDIEISGNFGNDDDSGNVTMPNGV